MPASLILAGAALAVSASSALAQTALWELDPDPPVYSFGNVVAAVDDVDGDAVPDVVVAAPRALIQGVEKVGEVRMLSGKSGHEIYALLPSTIQADAFFGLGLKGIEDTDGDGRGDFLVTTSLESPAGELIGAVAIVSGATGATRFELRGTAEMRIGSVVSSLGDVDGDAIFDSRSSWTKDLRL